MLTCFLSHYYTLERLFPHVLWSPMREIQDSHSLTNMKVIKESKSEIWSLFVLMAPPVEPRQYPLLNISCISTTLRLEVNFKSLCHEMITCTKMKWSKCWNILKQSHKSLICSWQLVVSGGEQSFSSATAVWKYSAQFTSCRVYD